MNMVKPTARDIDVGGELVALLNDLGSGYFPWDHDDETAPTWFDEDNPAHLRRLYDTLSGLLDRAPGFPTRVIGGMCYAICYPKNQLLDPADDCLALHPDLRAGLELLAQQRSDFFPRLEREAQAAVASTIEAATARHQREMATRSASYHWTHVAIPQLLASARHQAERYP